MDQYFDKEEFKAMADQLSGWLAEYHAHVDKFPVLSQVSPGEILEQLPSSPPADGEKLDTIFNDFEQKILPGITHWQSPNFHAYFPANNSTPSILAEFLTAGLGVQAMKWLTSPAATELEFKVLSWLRQMLDLPGDFRGVLQDTASVSTLCALIASREKATGGQFNLSGPEGNRLRVYCSTEAHASIEKAVRIAGIGSNNLVKIPVNNHLEMEADALLSAIHDDLDNGFTPTCIVAALGTTGTCAFDPLEQIGEIARENRIWLHIDAAYAGSAMILPEFRNKVQGLEHADSFVFNPHKWLFVNFDCSALFIRDTKQFQSAFRLVPEYLQSDADDEVEDMSNFGIQLGRRFRALKLWWVIRYYGTKGLQKILREHIRYAIWFEERVKASEIFELSIPRRLTVVCFRLKIQGNDASRDADILTRELLRRINESGKVFLSHTRVQGKFVIRMVTAQTYLRREHVEKAWKIIEETGKHILNG